FLLARMRPSPLPTRFPYTTLFRSFPVQYAIAHPQSSEGGRPVQESAPHGEMPAVLLQPAAPTAHITDEPDADHVHGGSDEQDCEHARQCPHNTATEWRFALHDRVHSQF